MTLIDSRILLELNGAFADVAGEWRGQLPRRTAVKGDSIVYNLFDDGPITGDPEAGFGFPDSRLPPVVEGRLVLRQFLDLAVGSPDDVRRFVADHGVLRLCNHGIPMTHPPIPPEGSPHTGLFCTDVEGDGTWGRERIADIKNWAQRGRAVLRIGAELQDQTTRRLGPHDAWRLLTRDEPRSRPVAVRMLNRELGLWLWLGLVRPMVDLDSRPRYRLMQYGPFGTIASELVSAVLNGSVALCVSCGRAFEPGRRRGGSRDTYCPDARCQNRSRAEASRRYRQ